MNYVPLKEECQIKWNDKRYIKTISK